MNERRPSELCLHGMLAHACPACQTTKLNLREGTRTHEQARESFKGLIKENLKRIFLEEKKRVTEAGDEWHGGHRTTMSQGLAERLSERTDLRITNATSMAVDDREAGVRGNGFQVTFEMPDDGEKVTFTVTEKELE